MRVKWLMATFPWRSSSPAVGSRVGLRDAHPFQHLFPLDPVLLLVRTGGLSVVEHPIGHLTQSNWHRVTGGAFIAGPVQRIVNWPEIEIITPLRMLEVTKKNRWAVIFQIVSTQHSHDLSPHYVRVSITFTQGLLTFINSDVEFLESNCDSVHFE